MAEAAVLAVVRDRWWPDADEVVHLPIGFGAWHWRVTAGGRHALFVTLDRLGNHHTADSLEAVYAGAAELAGRGLDFVVPSLPGPDGRFTAGFGSDALSATRWHDGTCGDGPFTDEQARTTARLLAALHAEPPPVGLPRWHPLVGPDLPEVLGARTLAPWTNGPLGETARAALRDGIDDIARWTADYLRLAASTDPATWVATHGEPHTRNQLATDHGTLLVDWESLRLAPRERDLRHLARHGLGDPDLDLMKVFDLEWRLDEISQYADRLESPHVGTESDRVALGGLLHELTRDPDHSAENGARV
ncbi:MAG: hypothetical protein ACXWDL_09970 [Nocardioides sp.]